MIPEHAVGARLRDYVLSERIGAGGFGAVYRARQPGINREVAVKVILAQHAQQPEFIAHFEAEAQLVARLEHPHIVPLYDYWSDSSGAYLVMRLLRGGSLRSRLSEGPLDFESIARVLDEISRALATAHRAGVVHRDLKPDNILLDEAGNSYLADFGIAKPIGHVTQQEGVSGSIPYMAPEQLIGDPPTPAADIYSLGIMLYEMLTGQHPFGSASITQMIMKHLQEPIPTLDELPEIVREALNSLVQRATAKTAADRFQHAPELAESFRAIVRPGVTGATDAAITPPVSAQRRLLQAQVDQLYQQVNRLYEEAGGALDVEGQARAQQLQKQLDYRVSGLNTLVQFVTPDLPPRLRIPVSPPYGLIGAEPGFEQIKNLLLAEQSVTLLGPAGVGKTELAAALARDGVVQHRFDGQVVWFPLSATDNGFALLGEWLLGLGVEGAGLAGLATLEARRARLHDMLAARSTLVVVDQVWSVEQVEAALGLNAPGLVILATTRSNQMAAEALWHTVRLDALALEQRKALLAQLATEVMPDDAPLEQLALRIGGLPRDLILAATRLRRASGGGRLRREIDRLIATPAGAFEAGYASIRLSVEQVSETAQTVMCALAELPSEPNTLSEADLLAIFETLDEVDELVDASLLKLADERYALHPSFAEYARTHLRSVPELRARIIAHFVADAEAHAHDYPYLAGQHSNIEAALDLAHSAGLMDWLVRGAIALAGFWEARGLAPHSGRYVPLALNAATRPLDRAALLRAAARRAFDQGQTAQAEAYLDECLAVTEGQADPALVRFHLQALIQRATIKLNQRQFDAVRALLTRAETMAGGQIQDAEMSAIHNLWAGLALLSTGDAQAARDSAFRALDYARRAGDRPLVSKILQNLGMFETQLMRLDQAGKHLDESLVIARELGLIERVSGLLQNRGNLELTRGNLEAARHYFEESLQKARLSHNRINIGWSLLTLANVLASLQQFALAETHLVESFALATVADNQYLAVNVIHALRKSGELRIVHDHRDADFLLYGRVADGALAMGLDAGLREALLGLMARLSTTARASPGEIARSHYHLALIEGREFNEPLLAQSHLESCIRLLEGEGASALLDEAQAESVRVAALLGE